MTMWGFSSRKDHDSSTASTEVTTNDAKQSSPTKRSRRRMGRRRGGNDDNNDDTKGGAKSGPFSRKQPQAQQPRPVNNPNNTTTAALKTSTVMNQREEQQHHHHQQDINVDATDSHGIEILLDYNAVVRNKTQQQGNSRHEDNNNNTGGKQQQHHSRRSMSNNRTKDKRRSAPPIPQRPPGSATALTLHTPLHSTAPYDDSQSHYYHHHQPVISLEKDILAQRTKIYRAQFSVFFPIPTTMTKGSVAVAVDPSVPLDQRKLQHRVPLGGGGQQRVSNNNNNSLSYHEVLQLLQQANPVDEITAVRVELKKTQAEMDALEVDKQALEHKWFLKQQQQSGGSGEIGGTKLSSPLEKIDWDIHRLLSANRKLTNTERAELEQRRGRCVTAYLQNPRSEDAFLNKCCGAKAQPPKTSSRRKVAAVTLKPENCKVGGAGATIRHVSMLSKGSSFFVSRDNGKSYSWGQLPERFKKRMLSQGMDPVKVCGDLLYLSTGPNGYYYAEFRTGACWWGCAGEDKEFYDILQKWDVYRVVFGSTMTHTATIVDDSSSNNNNNHTTTSHREILMNSWIILGRDGRAAWKNLPSRLHQTLERRLANSAAPAEVALGSGDSYYVRFLDGTMDYCLPAELASVCEHIQHSGGTITDMALNPEVSHEFIVRHTEVPS